MRCSDAYFFVVACSFSAYCFAIFVSLCVISCFVVNGFFDVDLFLLCF